MINWQQLLGIIAIGAGLGLALIAIGPFAMRLLMASLAIWLINYGLRMQGLPPLQTYVWLWWNMLRRM